MSDQQKYSQAPGESRLRYAERILVEEDRIIIARHGLDLDGKPATPLRIMLEANRVLKSLDLPQIAGSSEWKV